jgi:hypothetical protein
MPLEFLKELVNRGLQACLKEMLLCSQQDGLKPGCVNPLSFHFPENGERHGLKLQNADYTCCLTGQDGLRSLSHRYLESWGHNNHLQIHHPEILHDRPRDNPHDEEDN